MVRLREHIHWLHGQNIIFFGKNSQITRLRGRVATYIYNPGRGSLHQNLCNIGVNTGPGRVKHNYRWRTIFFYERGISHIFHISCKEGRIGYHIKLGIGLCIFDSLGHILDSDHLRSYR